MSSTVGRAIVISKTNKSGGSLAKGDVVVIDSANDNAVTTTTTGATTVIVGVVIEENGIASNATGRVQFAGHVGLVNVNASVTRGHYGKTHTVVKQATDAGTSRVAGTFCLFTTGGTTPEADLFTQPDAVGAAGSVAGDAIWTTAGKVAVATGTATATEQWPQGHEFDYAEATSGLSVTAHTAATAQTALTGNAVSYDGSTRVDIDVFFPEGYAPNAGNDLVFQLYDGSTDLCMIGTITGSANNSGGIINCHRRLTPTAGSHTYSVRVWVNNTNTGFLVAGDGSTASSAAPGTMRIRKAGG